jgi:NAD(P)-dependent dehydrogenase (short-subunit alcohol dehydrogenase family)
LDLLEKLEEEAAADNLSLTVRKVDVTIKEDIEALAKDINNLDILFNCAGY